MKLVLGLLVTTFIVWVFWMTYVWVKRTSKDYKNRNSNKNY